MPKRKLVSELAPQNALLSFIKPRDFDLIKADFEPIKVERYDLLFEIGDTVKYAYFPCGNTLLSFLIVLSDGSTIETALIGREGAAGGIVSNGRLPAFTRCEIQLDGWCLRIPNRELDEAKAKSPALQSMFSRYADCLLAQISQSAACNAVHTVEQRAARWMLAVVDRTQKDTLDLHQQQLASMLGIGRSYMTRAITRLRKSGAIETRRGGITILKPDELAVQACECNNTIKAHFAEVLAGIYPDATK